MQLPGANPADALKQISKELKDKFDECGMQQVEDFTDDLDDILEKAKAGPGKLLEAAEKLFGEFKDNLQKALDNPSAFAPAGGMAACASWYGNSVAGKLKGLSDETSALVESVTKMASDIGGPFKQLGEILEKAMAQLEKSIKALAKLPKLVAKEIAGKDSPDDIAKMDCGPMKAALAGGDVDGPLDSIMSLKEILGSVVGVAETGVQALKDFIEKAPDMIKSSFDVPQPFCFLTSMLLSQAPQAMKDLLDMVENLKSIDLEPLLKLCKGTAKSICGLSVDMVKVPMAKFQESAGELVEKLDKTVQGAKLASGGPGGALKSVGGMFG